VFVDVVQDTAQLFELTLLGSGAGVFTLFVEFSELLLCIFTAAEQFAADSGDHKGEGGDKQRVFQYPNGVFLHADFSRVVEACSLSTRWMVAREKRWLFASWLRLWPR
jgi:hypothetical protein